MTPETPWTAFARELAAELQSFATRLATSTREFVKDRVSPLEKRIEALETRQAELDAQPKGLAFRGVWQRAGEYRRGDAVTLKDALWICVEDTSRGSEPGVGKSDWQMAVRPGDTRGSSRW